MGRGEGIFSECGSVFPRSWAWSLRLWTGHLQRAHPGDRHPALWAADQQDTELPNGQLTRRPSRSANLHPPSVHGPKFMRRVPRASQHRVDLRVKGGIASDSAGRPPFGRLSWRDVELSGDLVEVFPAVDAQGGALGQVSAQRPSFCGSSRAAKDCADRRRRLECPWRR